jgi:hypothetical protein
VNNFTVYEGRFPCKICKEEVKSMRFYKDTGIATLMCSQKHISKIQLCQVKYKKKKDYEREEREQKNRG